jgi:hypothetical protein
MISTHATGWSHTAESSGAVCAHGLLVARMPVGSASAVVPALVLPAVDLACVVAGALVAGAVDFQPVGAFSFGQALGHLLCHA